jgi:hypothetical protein
VAVAASYGGQRELVDLRARDRVQARRLAPWPALCAKVAKLRMSTLDGEVLPLATTELRAKNRWQK